MSNIFLYIEELISGMLPFAVLMVAGMYFTIKTKGYQFKNLFKSIKFCLCGKKDKTVGISSFNAVCNSLSATVGTGNIAGVAAAISIGGMGSVFWMWVSALVSMVIKALEIVIAVIYRTEKNGVYVGGPMYYIKNGLGKKFTLLALIFCLSGIFSSFTTGNITQVNSFVLSFNNTFVLKLFIGIIFGLTVAVVVSGGMQKITSFTSKVLPLMAVGYILLCIGVLIKNLNVLDAAFLSIFKGAFNPKSVTGGAVGSVFVTAVTGAQKGIFSNEAGLGTAGIAHAAAVDANPGTQGFFGIFEVFVDTVVICTLTALTIFCSGVIIDYEKVASSGLVRDALYTLYGCFSSVTLSAMLCLFGISSAIGWSVYGIECASFLFGKNGRKMFVFIYPWFCVLGAIINVDIAWRMSEIFNGIMLVVNVFAVLMLSTDAVKALKGENNGFKNKKTCRKFKHSRSGAHF